MDILGIIFPVFALIGIGYVLRAIGLVRPEWAHILNTFVYYVSLPALVATSFWRIEWHDTEIARLLAFQVGVLALFALLLWICLVLSGAGSRFRTAFLMTSSLGNTVYMGFPLGLLIFGEAGGAALVGAGTVQLLAGIIISFFAIESTVVRSRNWRSYFKDLLRNPLILSMLAGMLLNLLFLEESVPFIADTLKGLSATASPIALFALGAFMYGKFAHSHLLPALLGATIKLAVFPVFVFIASRLLGLTGYMTAISVVIAGMPNAATSFVLAEKYALEKNFVASSIFVSTILSAGTIYLLLNLLGY